jgi:hypothetical protein
MEKMFSQEMTSEAQPINVLEEAAQDIGFKGILFPKVGTEAYNRFVLACKNYSQEVFLEMTTHGRDITTSQSKRRRLHNQLCIMTFGLDHAAVAKRDPKDLQRVANLAHSISGREHFIENV